MSVTPVSENHVSQMQGALIAFAQSFLQMQALKAEEEKKQEKEKKTRLNHSKVKNKVAQK